MQKCANLIFTLVLIYGFVCAALAQSGPAATEQADGLKVIVVAPEAKSDSVIAVPPATSERMMMSQTGANVAPQNSANLTTWINKAASFNGLTSPDLQPWHIAITYDQFDEDGDNIHSGTFEEFWINPKKYKRIYKSDNFNQTDYATEQDLFRLGDEQWPARKELEVRAQVVDPFFYAATLQGFHPSNAERTFGKYTLLCIYIVGGSALSDPTQYCFEHDRPILRYSRGAGWTQTTYNGIVPFQGRNIARDVEVTNGGKPYLKLHVNTIELISHVDEADFTPPPQAVNLLQKRTKVSGVHPNHVTSYPHRPASLKGENFSVEVEFVIGKNGQVKDVHAVTGPSAAYKECEDAVKGWSFPPYLILGKPAEVETKIVFHFAGPIVAVNFD